MKLNDFLDPVLSAWQVHAPLPARFEERVWNRIERATPQTPTGWLQKIFDWVESAFRRPALAASYLALLLLLGLAAGWKEAEQHVARAQSQWSARYVQSVDPYLMPRN